MLLKNRKIENDRDKRSMFNGKHTQMLAKIKNETEQ